MTAKKRAKKTATPVEPDLRERSGSIDIQGDKLTSFLYDLLRDHLPSGTVENLVREASEPDVSYANGYLALYAHDLANRLR